MQAMFVALAIAGLGTSAAAAPAAPDLAAAFGARPMAAQSISPLGTKVIYLTPSGTNGTAVMVVDLVSGKTNIALNNSSQTMRPYNCGWKGETRIVCMLVGTAKVAELTVGFTRVISFDADGERFRILGQRNNYEQIGLNQDSGQLIDNLSDDPQHVLMSVNVLAESTLGTRLAQSTAGLSVQSVDVVTGAATIVVQPNPNLREVSTDGRGTVRFRGIGGNMKGYQRAKLTYFARSKAGEWHQVGTDDSNGQPQFTFQGFDESGDWLYVLKPLSGRQALYKVAVDGSGRSELLFSHPAADVEGVVYLGPYGRLVAARYTTDNNYLEYLDPELRKLASSLKKALPKNPDITVFDDTRDNTKLLIKADSADDFANYYVYDRNSRELNELLPAWPQLKDVAVGTTRTVHYPTADGVMITASLTLPPTVPAKNLRTMVMPGSAPNWFSAYYAALGYAVLQPRDRSASSYSEAWFRNDGFKTWRTAVGDLNDGARWLVAQGIAAKDGLATIGWGYGGYSALQASVLDPRLYKAVIAVAPVTDLEGLRAQSSRYVNALQVDAFIGNGPHVSDGSPARNAAAIQAPVLMFAGNRDYTINIAQAQAMDAALARAGKVHELKIYPGLDHGLDDSAARTDLLQRSAAFLAENIK